MSEYKRLTNKDWKENYDIFEDVCCDTCAKDCGECEKNFNALVRLAEIEDKIESGKLCDKKETAKRIYEKAKKKKYIYNDGEGCYWGAISLDDLADICGVEVEG